jgi:hypothetical protein
LQHDLLEERRNALVSANHNQSAPAAGFHHVRSRASGRRLARNFEPPYK